MAPKLFPWGTIILHLDNETFRKAFTQGRRMYFDDSEYDFSHIVSHMSTHDAVGSVLDEDGKGGYCFDQMASHRSVTGSSRPNQNSRVAVSPSSRKRDGNITRPSFTRVVDEHQSVLISHPPEQGHREKIR
ncbi:MAG: hypothetical protein WCD86_22800 [Ktedonobacteraceae bacterium]